MDRLAFGFGNVKPSKPSASCRFMRHAACVLARNLRARAESGRHDVPRRLLDRRRGEPQREAGVRLRAAACRARRWRREAAQTWVARCISAQYSREKRTQPVAQMEVSRLRNHSRPILFGPSLGSEEWPRSMTLAYHVQNTSFCTAVLDSPPHTPPPLSRNGWESRAPSRSPSAWRGACRRYHTRSRSRCRNR